MFGTRGIKGPCNRELENILYHSNIRWFKIGAILQVHNDACIIFFRYRLHLLGYLRTTHTQFVQFIKLLKNWRCENYGCKEMPVIVLWIFLLVSLWLKKFSAQVSETETIQLWWFGLMTFPTGRWPLAMQCSIGTKMARGVSVPILMRTWHDPPLSDFFGFLFKFSLFLYKSNSTKEIPII